LSRSRICFVLPSLNGGGAERAAVHILNALSPERWQRSMFLFSRTGPYLDEVDPSIQLESAAGEGRTAQWRALRAFIARTRPQVVVSFLSYFSVLTAVRAAAVGAQVVFNQQTPMSAFLADGDYPWRRGWRRTVFNVATRRGYAAADLIVTTSQGVADDLVTAFGVRRDHIAVVPNPVDLDAVREAARESLDPAFERAWQAPVIVAAGRLAEAKNYPLLIDAMAILRQSIDARLFILGTGDEEATLRARIRERGLEYAITLCGFQKNPWKYIARADVFALSSYYEGFGNVLIEAMACAVPVVATASAGTRDIVRDGVDGILVERHQPEAFAGALAAVLGNPQRRGAMAAAASDSAPRFALPRIAQIYDDTFKGVMA
jgi:glycosyltransferase involved in cell wall biosynthesis